MLGLGPGGGALTNAQKCRRKREKRAKKETRAEERVRKAKEAKRGREYSAQKKLEGGK